MRYLLDTNVLSEAVKTVPDRNVMDLLERHQHEIATAAPVWHELRYGCLRLPVSRKRELIEAYLEDVIWRNMDILPYDERAAEWHAQQRARLSAQGLMPSFVDGQIAAIALLNGLILVTRNTSDFEIFEDVTVQNWHQDAWPEGP
ncbi:type II toxin-antitoxin system VapC family toxin [Thermodesulfobacteriota bacterium]